MDTAEFSQQEILERGGYNATAFIVGTMAFSKQHGFSIEEWARATGTLFAPGWSELAGKGARAVAREAALNMASCGATDVAVAGDDSRAEVTGHWPPGDLLASRGVSRAEITPFYHIFAPIVTPLGVCYEFAVEGDRFQFTFTR